LPSQQQLQNQHVPAFQHFAWATNTVTGLSAEETSGQEVNFDAMALIRTIAKLVALATLFSFVKAFKMHLSDRVAGKTGAAATFCLMTTAGGALAVGSNITLTYPSGFFASAGSPSVQISGGGPTGSVATPTDTQIVITTAAQAIDGSTAVTVTVTGLTMGGAPTAGGGISLATSVDRTASASVASGVIGGAVTSVTFGVALADRVANKTSAAATFAFTTTAGGALAAGSNITLTYPSGFFASAGSPSVQISGGGPTGSVATPTDKQIVITTAAQAIDGSTAVTVTVTGLTMGGTPTAGSNDVSISTSKDPIASSGVSSGAIGGQVTSTSFAMAASDRVAGKAGTAATFSFTTTAGGALAAGSNITLTYPSGFFASAGSPSVQISGGGPTGSVATPTDKQIVITTAAQAIDGSTAVTVTVTGLTMGGAPTAGGGISVATSVDQTSAFVENGYGRANPDISQYSFSTCWNAGACLPQIDSLHVSSCRARQFSF
jgi:hypothetical protein